MKNKVIEKIKYDNENNLFLVEVPFYDKDTIRMIDGAVWNRTIGCWTIPMTITNYQRLNRMIYKMPEEITKIYEKIKAKKERIEKARNNETEIIKMPIKLKPYKHQIRAFNMAMEVLEIL